LSKVLLAFAVEFERESPLALAISANVLRLFAAEGAEADRTEAIRVRDLPRLAGVSKEAIAFTVSFLTKRGFAVVEAEAADSRTKVLKLTRKGQLARDQYHALVKAVEERWRSRFGADTIARLRETLEELAGSGDAKSPLFQGLDPHPDNWRAKIKRAETLPHYPMVLHRGGYPDGS
jgi:DNA-binding MarR family transcriptional regulator